MKTRIFAYITIVTLIAAVIANTIYLELAVSKTLNSVRELDVEADCAEKNARELWAEFMTSETYISLTVSHDDLTNIEDGFAELIGCLEIKDTDSATVVKNRLINSLEHLKRLSGVNFDAVI